jgi:hypothetical protein
VAGEHLYLEILVVVTAVTVAAPTTLISLLRAAAALVGIAEMAVLAQEGQHRPLLEPVGVVVGVVRA